jgi:hypothetical protein
LSNRVFTQQTGEPAARALIARTIRPGSKQKKDAVVRRLAGYGRLTGLAAAGTLQRLYASARLYVNFLQSSFKLAKKRRKPPQVHKRYYPPPLTGSRTTEGIVPTH